MSSGGGISLPSPFLQIKVEQKEKGVTNGVNQGKQRQTEQRALDKKKLWCYVTICSLIIMGFLLHRVLN